MKAIILAAGRGSRIYSVTRGMPKCLLPFGEQTILDLQIENLFLAGITDVAIVVGYRKNVIIHHVEQEHWDKLKHIEFITNPEFASTNNMYSLWLARDWLAGAPFLCLNADVLFHPDILPPAVATREDLCVIIDRHYREETTKVITRGHRVLALSKSISPQECTGTFINISSFSGSGPRILFARAESLFAKGERNQFYNDVLSQLAAEGVRVGFTENTGLPWAEVDDADDLLFARTQVYPELQVPVFSGAHVSRNDLQNPAVEML